MGCSLPTASSSTTSRGELQRLVRFLVKHRTPGRVPTLEEEETWLLDAMPYLQLLAGRVEIHTSDVDHPRAKNGLPGRPAVAFD